jgi:hypothetical protein
MFKNVSYRETAYLQKRYLIYCGKAQSYSVSFCLLSYKTFTENLDSKAPSVGTLLAYFETMAF